jgi:signal transduction histidine kinase
LAASFKRQSNGIGIGTDLWVVILFDHEKLSASSWRAALLPLLTGLSTIAAVTLVMLVASSRIINRIRRLQTQVEVIASGNFEARLANPSNDELGKLSDSINRMAEQLRQLWNQIHQQQRSRLLHQMASGISHQLRNTLTGARMAMELHAKSCQSDRIDEVHVALGQLEIAENYVKRITVVGSGEQQPAEPKSIADCLKEIQATHCGVAEHLQVDLSWEFESPPVDQCVDNGGLFVAAISNLLLNAIQASSRVFVRGKILHNQLVEIEVIDEGSGIPPDLQDEVFQPFYTTKPEGMGLGLAMVKQIAEQLGGNVIYDRRDDQSIFRFQCKTHQVTQRIAREHE